MDYLIYTYLQEGRADEAARDVSDLKGMTGISGASFKIGYAGNAMPVRLAIETRDWATAAQLTPTPSPRRRSRRSCGGRARSASCVP